MPERVADLQHMAHHGQIVSPGTDQRRPRQRGPWLLKAGKVADEEATGVELKIKE
jgi:hypothetical protein